MHFFENSKSKILVSDFGAPSTRKFMSKKRKKGEKHEFLCSIISIFDKNLTKTIQKG
jgi:uncharacterized phage-like protein YoqJ